MYLIFFKNQPNQTKTRSCEFKYFKMAQHENRTVFM